MVIGTRGMTQDVLQFSCYRSKHAAERLRQAYHELKVNNKGLDCVLLHVSQKGVWTLKETFRVAEVIDIIRRAA